MIRVVSVTLAVIFAVVVGIAPRSQAKETAVCMVCKVMEGESQAEEVKAFRTHDGVRHGFCSEKCAKEFDADPAAFVPPSFPRPAPELSLSDLAGRPVTWEGLRGKVVLLDFWATWCAPCRKSMPELQALHDKHAARGFTVIGVSIDEGRAAGKVKKFLASRKITYPIVIDSQKSPAWERFRVKAVPAAFLVDPEGRIVAQWTGTTAATHEIEERIDALLARVD